MTDNSLLEEEKNPTLKEHSGDIMKMAHIITSH